MAVLRHLDLQQLELASAPQLEARYAGGPFATGLPVCKAVERAGATSNILPTKQLTSLLRMDGYRWLDKLTVVEVQTKAYDRVWQARLR